MYYKSILPLTLLSKGTMHAYLQTLLTLMVCRGIDSAPQSQDNGKVEGYGISVNANVNVQVNVVQPGTAPDPDIPGSLLVSSSGPAGTVQLGAMGLYRAAVYINHLTLPTHISNLFGKNMMKGKRKRGEKEKCGKNEIRKKCEIITPICSVVGGKHIILKTRGGGGIFLLLKIYTSDTQVDQ